MFGSTQSAKVQYTKYRIGTKTAGLLSQALSAVCLTQCEYRYAPFCMHFNDHRSTGHLRPELHAQGLQITP